MRPTTVVRAIAQQAAKEQAATATATATTTLPVSSLGFSGAGFMACYHLGVAQCLKDQGIWKRPREGGSSSSSSVMAPDLALTGVSGGALVAAALAVGIAPHAGMEAVLQVADETARQPLDVLHPGFSLIDVVETHFSKLLHTAVRDNFESERHFLQLYGCDSNHNHNNRNSRNSSSRLRIGLTDRRLFPPLPYSRAGTDEGSAAGRATRREQAFCYVDTFRSVDDIIAACILSSYVPALTGSVWGSWRPGAVRRASVLVHELIREGRVKRGICSNTSKAEHDLVQLDGEEEEASSSISPQWGWWKREVFWDGGLVNAFPVWDEHTVIVSPLAANFRQHRSINPAILLQQQARTRRRKKREQQEQQEINENDMEMALSLLPPPPPMISHWNLNSRVQIHLTAENAHVLRTACFSSDHTVLEDYFRQGYDHAMLFLQEYNLQTVFSVPLHGHFGTNYSCADPTIVHSSSEHNHDKDIIGATVAPMPHGIATVQVVQDLDQRMAMAQFDTTTTTDTTTSIDSLESRQGQLS